MPPRDRTWIRRAFVPTPDTGMPLACTCGLTVQPDGRTVSRHGVRLKLPPRQHALLRLLVRHPGRAVTHEEITAYAWSEAFVSVSAVVKAVSRLREQLRAADLPHHGISTVRSLGYRWDPQSCSPPTLDLDQTG